MIEILNLVKPITHDNNMYITTIYCKLIHLTMANIKPAVKQFVTQNYSGVLSASKKIIIVSGVKDIHRLSSDVPRFRVVVATRERVGSRRVVWGINFVCQR